MEKRVKAVSTVQELLESYFPNYEKRRQEASIEEYERSGVVTAMQIAKEYQPKRKVANSNRKKAPRKSS
ncbi:hypothetical protein HUU05_25225 [candidate division KSB1 bacterium]|nr:hypothetical protein [candidate division KSB1 bacterium]